MEYIELVRKLQKIINPIHIELNADMRKNTSFRIGGPADIIVKPQNLEQLQEVVKLINSEKVPFLVIGNGSNLLVSDSGIKGVVIKLSSNFNNIVVSGEVITAQSGALLPLISSSAIKNNLTGFEFAAGIPGTLGGAITMNAGAHGGEMKDIVTSVTVMDYEGNIQTLSNQEMEFEYRNSILSRKQFIVVSVDLKLEYGDSEEIKSKINELKQKRILSQPLDKPNAGSTFKRPLNAFAGKLIEDAGLKGFSVGDAEVSTKHAGFVINKGNASARDVLEVIDHVKKVVFEKYNIELEEEVRLIGF